MKKFICLILSLAPFVAWTADLAECSGIQADPVRLACYDRLAQAAAKRTVIVDSGPDSAPMLPKVEIVPPPPSPVSALSERWELDDRSKAGTFQFRAHHPTYILPLSLTSQVNRLPSSPAYGRSATTANSQKPSEVKFQLSFKTKLMESLFDGRSDLWFGYTQQSHWQIYNDATSRDFRATDYAPELILTTRTDYDVLGWRGRLVNLGVLHQSNGRDEPLSRSWNRVYVQAGLERGNWVLMVRPWWRVPEGSNDDNPDITRYLGHGDVSLLWKRDGHVVSLLARQRAAQADWAIPLSRHLKAHLQLFSGYGESMIDYNHRQTQVGVGISLSEGL